MLRRAEVGDECGIVGGPGAPAKNEACGLTEQRALLWAPCTAIVKNEAIASGLGQQLTMPWGFTGTSLGCHRRWCLPGKKPELHRTENTCICIGEERRKRRQ